MTIFYKTEIDFKEIDNPYARDCNNRKISL